MADITVKRHDTWPAITTTLEQLVVSAEHPNGQWVPIILTGALKVTFIMKSEQGAILIEGLCSVTNPISGTISYVWGPSDTSVAGTYNAEFEIEWGIGKIQSVPNEGYRQIVIGADLPNA